MDIVEIAERLAAGETKIEENSTRIEELERRQDNLDELVGTVKVLANREERVEEDVKEIKNDVKTLTGKPGEKWDELWKIVLTAVVSIIVGFIFAKISMSL